VVYSTKVLVVSIVGVLAIAAPYCFDCFCSDVKNAVVRIPRLLIANLNLMAPAGAVLHS
jgi:hypothetical protein